MPPSMDTAAVLRRLRLEEGSGTSTGVGGEQSPQTEVPPRSALTPLGIVRRESGGPSDQYLQTRRRSASAPPPVLAQGVAGLGVPFSVAGRGARDYDRERERERDSANYDRRSEMLPPSDYSAPSSAGHSPGRYRHGYSHSGSEAYSAASNSTGPARNAYHQHHLDRHHHPYAAPIPSRPSTASSIWTKQHSPSFEREAAMSGVDEPLSPASSVPPPNPHTTSMHAHYTQSRSPPRSPPNAYALHRHEVPHSAGQRIPSSRGAFIGISHHAADGAPLGDYDEKDEMDEDEDMSDSRVPHSSFVRGEAPRSPVLRRGSDEDADMVRRNSTTVRHRDSNASSRAGDAVGSGLEALARAAASASASQASTSPPHKTISTVDSSNRPRPSDASDRDIRLEETPARAPVRPW